MEQNCAQCGHPFDPHVIVATEGDPVNGGIILCPEKDCECYATWDVPQLGGTREAVREPDAFELLAMREKFQS